MDTNTKVLPFTDVLCRLEKKRFTTESSRMAHGCITVACTAESAPCSEEEKTLRPDVDLVLCVDCSGSMFAKMPFVCKCVDFILRSMAGSAGRIAVVSFADKAEVLRDLLPVSMENIETEVLLCESLSANGLTDLAGGMIESLKLLQNKFSPNRAVILISDGVATSGISSSKEIKALVQRVPGFASTMLFSVAIGMDVIRNYFRNFLILLAEAPYSSLWVLILLGNLVL
jgi:Mg-chelatase subunit ChlD